MAKIQEPSITCRACGAVLDPGTPCWYIERHEVHPDPHARDCGIVSRWVKPVDGQGEPFVICLSCVRAAGWDGGERLQKGA